jgi:hypothetical protein
MKTSHIIFSQPTRVTVGLLLIVLFTLVSNLQFVRIAISARGTIAKGDEVTRYEARFQKLRQTLPSRGVVGYVSDSNPEGFPRNREYFRRYYLTQYSLAPLVVVNSTEPDLLIGDVDSAAHSERVITPGFTLVKDFGDGVMLFRRGSHR